MARYTAAQEAADIELAVALTDEMRDLEAKLADIAKRRGVVFARILDRGKTSLHELSRRCDIARNAIREAAAGARKSANPRTARKSA